MTDKINIFLDYASAIIAGSALCLYVIRYSLKSTKERGVGQGALLSVTLLLVSALIVGAAMGFALGISRSTEYVSFASVIWAEIYIFVFLYYKGRTQAEGRGFYFVLLHLLVLTAGWVADRWLGMLFYSAPLLFIFHHIVRSVALVTIPASNPEDKYETKQRIKVFLSYVLGMQMPLWNVLQVNDSEAEKRVDGAPVLNDFAPFPGMIKTHSNQVVGISNGINFRVEGPGVIFTKKGDQPFEIVDLRVKTRISNIHAYSKEGIPFLAKVNVTFKIEGEKPDRNLDGLFPYQSARVRSALYLRSKREQPDGEIEHWGDHVLYIAEEAAREILAEQTITELWNLENSTPGNIEPITKKMETHIQLPLLAKGVHLNSAKALPDFSNINELTEKERDILDKIIKQQIDIWSQERKKEIATARSEAQIYAEHTEQEARVQAYSALLTAIAEGVQTTHARGANIVRKIILLRYVSVLEELINEQPRHLKNENRPKSQTHILRKIGDGHFNYKRNK